MRTLKIHIPYKFKEGPWGGGNQFLKALRDYFIDAGQYAQNMEDADILVFNSFFFGSEYLLNKVYEFRKHNPRGIVLHRIDGPISLSRKNDGFMDKATFYFNAHFADAAIYQSDWCKLKYRAMGINPALQETTILNAPNPLLFFGKTTRARQTGKIKLIATSWSGNKNKGFAFYDYLDRTLDFSRFEMTFVGTSPIEFKNIKHIQPVPSKELGEILRTHDIFITASKNDACSNSLIEAMHCGLPAVALNDGGNPEIIKEAGALFSSEQELITAIEKVAGNLSAYEDRIALPSIQDIGESYYNFALKVYNNADRIHCGYRNLVYIRAFLFKYKLISKMNDIRRKFP